MAYERLRAAAAEFTAAANELAIQRLKTAAVEFTAAVNELAGAQPPAPTPGTGDPTKIDGGILSPYTGRTLDAHSLRIEDFGGVAVRPADAADPAVRAKNDQAIVEYYSFRSTLMIPASALLFGPGIYHFGKPLRLNRGFHYLRGLSSGTGGVDGTYLRFPADQEGIVIDDYNTNGFYPDDTAPGTAGGSIVEGLHLWSFANPGPADPTYYRKRRSDGAPPASGILMRTRAHIRNVAITGFPGQGIYVIAANEWRGNANCFEITHCRAQYNGDCGLFVIGADANAGNIQAFDGSWNGSYAIADYSFLGNYYRGCHAEANGWYGIGRAPYPTMVFHNGTVWKALSLNEGDTLSATYGQNEPGTAPAVWEAFYDRPDPAPDAPPWQQGHQYMSGGAYTSMNENGRNNWDSCYSESGQPPSDLFGPCTILGGFHAAFVTKRSPPAFLDARWDKPVFIPTA
jgi:hypothetical protein